MSGSGEETPLIVAQPGDGEQPCVAEYRIAPAPPTETIAEREKEG